MPTYQVFFDDHTGTTTLIQVWAETQEQAVLKAKGQAIYIAKRAGNPVMQAAVRAVEEVAPSVCDASLYD